MAQKETFLNILVFFPIHNVFNALNVLSILLLKALSLCFFNGTFTFYLMGSLHGDSTFNH